MLKQLLRSTVGLLAVVLLAAPAVGQTAQRVPDDALVYLTWSGGEAIADAAEGTRAGNILKASKLPAFFDQTLAQVIERVRRDNPEVAQGLAAAYTIAGEAWTEPSAFYVVARPQPGGPPEVFGALVIDAGPNAAELQNTLQNLLAQDRNAQQNVELSREGELVRLSFGTEGNAFRPVANAMSDSARHAALLQQVHAQPLATFYVDVQQVLTLVSEVPMRDVPPEVAARTMPALQASGVADLQQFIATFGFEDDGMFATRAFVSAPGERRGFFKTQPAKPFDPALLGVAPASTTRLVAVRFNAAEYLQTLRTAANEVDDRADDLFERGLSAANAFLGRNLTRDVLEPLGDEWIIFASPDLGGTPPLGLVVVNKLDDPARARDALTQVAFSIDNTVSTALRRVDSPVRVVGRSEVYKGARIYYLGTPILSPAWAVKGDYLVLGFLPQNVMATLDVIEGQGPSILEAEKFKAAMAMLGREDFNALTFTDLEETAGDAYATWVMVMRGAVGAADLFGIEPPGIVMPPYTVIRQNLTPMASAAWASEAGFHAVIVEPFPGSSLLSIQPGSVEQMQLPMMMGVLLPSLQRARETARQAQAMNSLRQIGMGVAIYATDNQGQFPPDLYTLLENDILQSPEVFISASTGTQLPGNWQGMTDAQRRQWVADESDVQYVGAGKKQQQIRRAHETIIAYTRLDRAADSISILYADGHVERKPLHQALPEIQRQGAAPNEGGL